MTKEFRKELKALAKKHKLVLYDECVYCGHGKECVDTDDCYYFTVVSKEQYDKFTAPIKNVKQT